MEDFFSLPVIGPDSHGRATSLSLDIVITLLNDAVATPVGTGTEDRIEHLTVHNVAGVDSVKSFEPALRWPIGDRQRTPLLSFGGTRSGRRQRTAVHG